MKDSRRVPVGMIEFDQLANDVHSLVVVEVPGVTIRDVRYIVASSIINIKPTDPYVSISELAEVVITGAARQVASQVFQDIQHEVKREQKAAQEAATLAAATNENQV